MTAWFFIFILFTHTALHHFDTCDDLQCSENPTHHPCLLPASLPFLSLKWNKVREILLQLHPKPWVNPLTSEPYANVIAIDFKICQFLKLVKNHEVWIICLGAVCRSLFQRLSAISFKRTCCIINVRPNTHKITRRTRNRLFQRNRENKNEAGKSRKDTAVTEHLYKVTIGFYTVTELIQKSNTVAHFTFK